jgi:hypothetical protein
VAPAREGPLARHAIAAVGRSRPALRVQGAGHHEARVGVDALRAGGLEGGAQEAEVLDPDHQVPAGRAIGARDRLDGLDLRARIALTAAKRGRRRNPVEPGVGHGGREPVGEVALALRLVGALADERLEGPCACDRAVAVGGSHASMIVQSGGRKAA